MVDEQSKSKSHIDVLLSACESIRISLWRLTGFYREPRQKRQKESCYLMRFLRAQSASPWLCVGDFSEVPKCWLEKKRWSDNGHGYLWPKLEHGTTPVCPFYPSDEEAVDHLFARCSRLGALVGGWARSPLRPRVTRPNP